MYIIALMMVGVLRGWVKWRDVNVGIMELVGAQENVKNALVMAMSLNAIFTLREERKVKV